MIMDIELVAFVAGLGPLLPTGLGSRLRDGSPGRLPVPCPSTRP